MAKINLRDIPPEVMELVPESLVTEHFILPLAVDDQYVSIAYPYDIACNALTELDHRLRLIFNRSIELIAFRREELQEAIEWYYRDARIEACGATSPSINYRCPRWWLKLVPTEVATVRYCTECQEPVYLYTTEEELASHIQANHCVARHVELSDEDISLMQEFCSYDYDVYAELAAPPPPRMEVPVASPRLPNERRSLSRPIE
jgi:hypothetical protein